VRRLAPCSVAALRAHLSLPEPEVLQLLLSGMALREAGLWLEAPLAVLRARVTARRGDASDADVAVLEAAAARPVGPLDWAEIPAAADPVPAARARLRGGR
jgi:predicted kinase